MVEAAAPITPVPSRALDAVKALLLGTRAWSSGGTVDLDDLGALRADLVRDNHLRHVASIPAYGRLTEELGVSPAGGERELLLSDEWFKSYDPGWADSDLQYLTAWLAEVSTVRPPHPTGATDLADWRSALRAHDVFVTVSSGTTGSPSLVPRDRMTLAALRGGSGVRLPWALPAGAYDALLLTPRGMGSGIQSGASGIAAAARNAAHDDDEQAWTTLLTSAAADRQPLVVYGSPARLARLLDRVTDGTGARALPPGSCVVTGGGWKGQSTDVEVGHLLEAASETFALPRERCVDTYSTAELNTVLVSCREQRYHVPPVVEAMVVDEQLQPIPGDADGPLAVLDPLAMSYPGRLVTSDVVRLRHDPCPCGLAGQTLLPGITRAVGAAARGCGVTDRIRP